MATRTEEVEAAFRLAKGKATLGLLVTTALVMGLFMVRRDSVTAVLALTLILFFVTARIRSWARTLNRARS